MNKMFFVVAMISVVLLSGCTLPPEGHPPPNHNVHYINETPYPLRIIEDGFMVQRCLLPGQSQVLSMTLCRDSSLQKAYRLVAYRQDEYTGEEVIVATANFVLRIRGVDYGSVVSRVFIIKYEGGTNLIVEEADGSGGSLFW